MGFRVPCRSLMTLPTGRSGKKLGFLVGTPQRFATIFARTTRKPRSNWSMGHRQAGGLQKRGTSSRPRLAERSWPHELRSKSRALLIRFGSIWPRVTVSFPAGPTGIGGVFRKVRMNCQSSSPSSSEATDMIAQGHLLDGVVDHLVANIMS